MTPNTLGTPARQSEHDFDLISCQQRAHSILVAVSLFMFRFLRRADEDFQRYNRRIRTNYALGKGW